MSLYYTLKEKLFPADKAGPNFTPQFRLEGKLRDANRTEALAMRTADPLWMLGRQWQFGEFIAEDNGSPVSVNTHYQKTHANYLSTPSSARVPIKNQPPEMMVEAMEVEPTDLRSKARIGQRFEQMIKDAFAKLKAQTFINKMRSLYPLHAQGAVDAKSLRFFKLMQGKVVDGADLMEAIEKQKFPYKDFPELAALAHGLKEWHQDFMPSPTKDSAWNASQLSHQFELHKQAKNIADDFSLQAPDYQSGHFDWFSFDQAKIKKTLKKSVAVEVQSTPVNASFAFMPEKRLFAFEDRQLDLSKMEMETDDLIKIMLLDFVLVSGSDWFTVPLEMKLGELCWVNKVMVKDVFGVSTTIKNNEQTGSILNENPLKVWDVFKIRNTLPKKYEAKDHFLFLAPAATRRMESQPVEELLFQRDENANMVWAQERTIPNAMGTPRNGYELHLEMNGPPSEEPETDNLIPKYRLSSPIPTDWIPYLPRHENQSNSRLALHRAMAIRNSNELEPIDIEPLSFLANKDLKVIQEEAIPMEGLRIQLTKQRMRGFDGETYVWMGRKILTGNGAGDSGLRFDYLV